MELRLILLLVRRWAWLLIIGALLGGAGAYYVGQQQEPTYVASTKVMVTQSLRSRAADVQVLSDRDLTETYIELLATRPVISATAERLGYPINPSQISARRVGSTGLLEVVVRDSDPDRAADIANEVVEVLIAQNESLQAGLFASTEESLQAQIAQVEEQLSMLESDISETSEESLESRQEKLTEELANLEEEIYGLQSEISTLEVEIETLTPQASLGNPAPTLTPGEQSQLSALRTDVAQKRFQLGLAQDQYSALVTQLENLGDLDAPEGRSNQQQSTLALYQQIYSNLLSSYEAVRLARLQNTAHVVQVEAAVPPRSPMQSGPLNNILLGASVGLIVMGAIAFVIEYMDDTLKTPQDISRIADLPVIGYIEDTKSLENGSPLLANAHFGSPTVEAFRTLRTNLELASTKEPPITILITSIGIEDGKTTVALNLATMYGQAGYQTILVDADLRRPSIHSKIGISNREGGLSNLIRDRLLVREVIRETRDIDNVRVIPSGELPPNPTELLRSSEMGELLEDLKEIAEVVIVDSPPMVVSDAVMLATKVDAVILVAKPGQVTIGGFRAAVEQLHRADAPIVGVVLNRIPQRLAQHYQAYRSEYYGHLDGKAAGKERKLSGKRFLRQVFGRS